MIGEHIQPPDLCEKVTAFRTWHISADFCEGIFLRSYSYGEKWSKHMKACCGKGERHVSPEQDCTCGLYGFFDHQAAQKNNCGIVGVCEFYGKTQIHKDGLRSQYANIKSLYCPEWTLEEMVNKKRVSPLLGLAIRTPYSMSTNMIKDFTQWIDQSGIKICFDYQDFLATNSNPIDPKLREELLYTL